MGKESFLKGKSMEKVKRGFTYNVVTLLLYFVLFLFLSGFGGSVVLVLQRLMTSSLTESSLVWDYLLPSVMTLLAVYVSTVLLLFIEKRSFSRLGFSFKGHISDICYATLFAILFYTIGFSISYGLAQVEVLDYHIDWTALALGALLFLLVAFTEEMMMRGYILGKLLDAGVNKFMALIISSVLFAMMHLFNPNISFLPMVNLVLAGILLGSTYIYTRNLWFPITLHFLWNFIQGPFLGYEVSGNAIGISVLELHLPENNIVNGGTFGFEGSMVCTILMVISIVGFIYWGEKKPNMFHCTKSPLS